MPCTLYLVVPPSDISRTKPLVRLILNQIGRRLTEELDSKDRRHRLLLMLDEFPALGRLDFFESALAFMAGYGLKSFLIAQSLNQIEKAYGINNSILDNCHVRVSFATNDERTAKRVSDALGTATEIRDAKNYAGHRLSPWLGHLMVSRQETARPLLTPGEVMQLPPDDELVLVSGCHPIRARKARYFEDPQLQARILPPPVPSTAPNVDRHGRRSASARTTIRGRKRSSRPRGRPKTRTMRASAGSPSFPSRRRSCSSRASRCASSSWQMTSLRMLPRTFKPCSAERADWPGRSRSIPATAWTFDACAPSTHSACRRTWRSSSPTTPSASAFPRRWWWRRHSRRSCRLTARTGWKRHWRGGSIA